MHAIDLPAVTNRNLERAFKSAQSLGMTTQSGSDPSLLRSEEKNPSRLR